MYTFVEQNAHRSCYHKSYFTTLSVSCSMVTLLDGMVRFHIKLTL